MVHPSPTTRTCTSLTGDCANSIPNAVADLAGCRRAHRRRQPENRRLRPLRRHRNLQWLRLPHQQRPKSSTSRNGFNNNVHVDNVVAKIDYRFNERNGISGMYFFGNNSGTVEDFPELQTKWLSDIHTRAQVVGGSWVWTPNPRWVNEARVGYNRLYQPTLPGDLNTPASAYG